MKGICVTSLKVTSSTDSANHANHCSKSAEVGQILHLMLRLIVTSSSTMLQLNLGSSIFVYKVTTILGREVVEIVNGTAAGQLCHFPFVVRI